MGVVSANLTRARSILRSAEDEVRALIGDSLAAQRYDEVAQLAAIARQLFQADGDGPAAANVGGGSNGNHLSSVHPDLPSDQHFEPRPRFVRPASNGQYPQFEREGNRLVKIGWSKKDRRVYEHKTSLTAVSAVCDALRKQTGRFLVDQILPIKDSEGTDVPSYQAYLVLAWLRKEGLVERNGNDGYTASATGLSADQIAKRFDSLPTR